LWFPVLEQQRQLCIWVVDVVAGVDIVGTLASDVQVMDAPTV